MNLKGLLIVFICFVSFIQSALPADKKKDPVAYREHTVTKGETAYSIAASYNITVKELYQLNPKAEKGIKEKQSLKIPLTSSENTKGYIYHSINVKETLYSVSKLYNISQDAILAANPGLTTENFTIGKAIKIPTSPTFQSKKIEEPRKPIEHIVKPKETLYSISKLYDVSIEEIQILNPEVILGLRHNTTIYIPQKNTSGNPTEYVVKKVDWSQNSVMKIGMLLPFQGTEESQTARFVEYYEGFLLAVEDIKAKGYSAEIYTFDIGSEKNTKKLESLLTTNEIKDLDLLIGGFYPSQVELLKNFSKKNQTKYLIPFPTKGVDSNIPNTVFQINAPNSYIYSRVASVFAGLFKDYNVVLLSDDKIDDKKDFVAELSSKLSQLGVKPRTTSFSNLTQNLSTTQKNIIVPISSSQKTLSKVFTSLNSISSQNSSMSISLFGYPDWQTYANLFGQDFYKYDTYLYTPFYFDNNNRESKQLLTRYKNWFGKTPLNTYPKYSVLGYDAGLYFMSAIAKYGPSFQSNLSELNFPTLQTAFRFSEINGVGGYSNIGLYLIHYKPNLTIDKIDYSK